MKTQTHSTTEHWTETQELMPSVGQKVIVYLWMDKTVNQAWWNGEHYILVAADEQGQVQVYQVHPKAISHWCTMPEHPQLANHDELLTEQRLTGTLH